MKELNKKIKRKIGALVILGIFTALILSSSVVAVDYNPNDITMYDEEWIGISGGGIINFDSTPSPDEIEITGAELGIGTTSPDRKLDVEDSSNPQLRLTQSSSVYTDFQTTSNGDLYIRPVGNVAGPRVGIGAISPQATLHVGGALGSAPGSIDRIAILGFSSPTLWIITARNDVVNAHLDLKYGATTILTTRDDGNVGIGTTTPRNKLDVEGGAVIGATYSGTNTAPTNGLLVEGNVGIGTASPQGALNVDNTGEAKGLGVIFDTYHEPTTDATPTTIATISTATDKAYGLTVTIIGIKSDGSDIAHYIRYASYKNDGGTLTEVDETDEHTVEDDANWDVSMEASGTDILVKVTGVAATTIQWQATVEMNIIGV